MNCLRFNIRTGLLALVAVLLVGGMMPVVAGAAEEKAGSFDPFDLDAMFAASLAAAQNTTVMAAPVIGQGDELRSVKVITPPQRPKLKTPFRPIWNGY